jgi:hypothetical protein
MTDKEQISAILEIVEFLRDNMATKQDVEQLRAETKQEFANVRREMATKQDIADFRSEVLEHIDGFAHQNQKFDQEVASAQAKFNRLEERLEIVEEKVGIAV